MTDATESVVGSSEDPRILQAVERSLEYRRMLTEEMDAEDDLEADNASAVYSSRRCLDRRASSSREYAAGKGRLIGVAQTALGVPYVSGGTSRAGFDCSGFVQWTYGHVGVKLPRTAQEQSQVGRPVKNIEDIKVGDIVAFRHPRRGYHTGIYVGDRKFIHSPRQRNVVRINSLDDPYFNSTFLGARRVKRSNAKDLEDAERMLSSYDREKYDRKAQTLAAAYNKKQGRARSYGKSKTSKSAFYAVDRRGRGQSGSLASNRGGKKEVARMVASRGKQSAKAYAAQEKKQGKSVARDKGASSSSKVAASKKKVTKAQAKKTKYQSVAKRS